MRRLKILARPVWDYVVKLLRTLVSGWSDFWFTAVDPATLGLMRICVGLVVLYIYGSTFLERSDLVGPHAWVDAQAIAELQQISAEAAADEAGGEGRWWGQSVWYYTTSDTAASLLYVGLLLAGVCLTAGCFSRTANLLVLIGHLSFVHRSYVAWFGMDSILSMLLLYMLIGPSGSAYSLDRWFARRGKRRATLAAASTTAIAAQSRAAPDDSPPSWTANVSLRLIQLHMCVIYMCSGLAKLQGETWWDGTAVLRSLLGYELALLDLRWLGGFSDVQLEWFSNLSVAATLVFEIGFAFLIWNRLLRPLLLVGAVALHLGIASLMGLIGFGVIMITGCLSFVAPTSIRWVLRVLREPPEPVAEAQPPSQDGQAAGPEPSAKPQPMLQATPAPH